MLVRTPTLLISIPLLAASSVAGMFSLAGLISTISVRGCVAGALSAYAVAYLGAIINGYARIRISGEYTRFLESLDEAVSKTSSHGRELLKTYAFERAKMTEESLDFIVLPWLLSRARKSRRRPIKVEPVKDRPTKLKNGSEPVPVRTPSVHQASQAKGGEEEQSRTLAFLCHGIEDKPKVRELYYALRSHGVIPWLDEFDLVPGQNWQMEITKAIRRATAVVVCLSPATASKTGFVQKEIRLALDVADLQPPGTIFIIPALLERCAVPDRLQHLHWVDLTVADGVEKLSNAIRFRSQSIE